MARVFAIVTTLLCFAGVVHADTQHFQSPSGNIRCVMVDDVGTFARCDLGVDEQTYQTPPPSCDGEWGTSFGVTDSGTGFVNCVTAAMNAPRNPVVLPYGSVAAIPGISCRSEPTGVTCTNADGGGFSVRRSAQRIF